MIPADSNHFHLPSEIGAPLTNPDSMPLSLVTIATVVRVPLTQGQYALLNVEDVPLIETYRWTALRSHNTWYAKANYKGRAVYMHRLIMFGAAEATEKLRIDHINGDGLDNRRANLRSVTHRQNMMNTGGKGSVRRSRYKGVSVRKHETKPFRACIENLGKQHHLGYFSDEIEAAKAYDKVALDYFSGCARLNFPDSGKDLPAEVHDCFVKKPQLN